jgi:hypothetical protein
MSMQRTLPLPDTLVLDFVFVPHGAVATIEGRDVRPESVALPARWRQEPRREDPWPNSF